LGSTFERSFVKGIVWEIISFILVIIAVYIIYGNLTTSIIFSLVLTIIKIPLFFIHERLWKGVRWGKIKDRRR
jgi:adenylylsulfate kinase